MKNNIVSRRNRRNKRSAKINSRKPFNRLFLFIILVCAGIFVYNFTFTKEEKAQIVEKTEEVVEEVKKPIAPEPEFDPKSEVENVIATYPGTDISVSYIDLEKGNVVNTYGSTESFLGASTTKLISATCLLREIEAGKYTLKAALGGSTIEWHLKQMINQSNNNSWDLIIRKIGYANLGNCAKNLGLTSFRTYNNSVAPRDIAVLLRDLYNSKVVTEANRDLLMSFMQNTNNEKLIAAAMPEGVEFWHKYGDYSGHLHDAAIVKDGDREYVLVIYTNRDTGTNYELQTEIIHKVTQVFTQNK